MLALTLMVAVMCNEAAPLETQLRLDVPKEVAEQKVAPVLLLDDLEVTLGRRMTIEVLGPPDQESGRRAILAVEGLTGSNRPPKDARKITMDLVMPLNERAVRLMAGQSEIVITVRSRHPREPLKFRRAYLASR
jgi:hypothetical protein